MASASELKAEEEKGLSGSAPDGASAARNEPSANLHTPGPWRLCGSERGGCACGQVWCPDYPVAIVTRGDWGDGSDLKRMAHELWLHFRRKGFGFFAYGAVGERTAMANAYLISAAPEMYEALNELLYEDSDKSDVDRIVTRLKARAAIAKAEGRHD